MSLREIQTEADYQLNNIELSTTNLIKKNNNVAAQSGGKEGIIMSTIEEDVALMLRYVMFETICLYVGMLST